MSVENKKIYTLAKLLPLVFHLSEEMKGLGNDEYICLLGSSKDSTAINPQPSHSQIDLEPLKSLSCDKNSVIEAFFWYYDLKATNVSGINALRTPCCTFIERRTWIFPLILDKLVAIASISHPLRILTMSLLSKDNSMCSEIRYLLTLVQ